MRTHATASVQGTKASVGMENELLDVVIVGAGVSGLVTAQVRGRGSYVGGRSGDEQRIPTRTLFFVLQALTSKHSGTVKNFLVTEARERVGGNITTVEGQNGFLWEEGPNSFQPNDAMLEVAVDSGESLFYCIGALFPCLELLLPCWLSTVVMLRPALRRL